MRNPNLRNKARVIQIAALVGALLVTFLSWEHPRNGFQTPPNSEGLHKGWDLIYPSLLLTFMLASFISSVVEGLVELCGVGIHYTLFILSALIITWIYLMPSLGRNEYLVPFYAFVFFVCLFYATSVMLSRRTTSSEQ